MDQCNYLECKGHVGEHIKYIVFDRKNSPVTCLLFGYRGLARAKAEAGMTASMNFR
jgi:hypothetical protein